MECLGVIQAHQKMAAGSPKPNSKYYFILLLEGPSSCAVVEMISAVIQPKQAGVRVKLVFTKRLAAASVVTVATMVDPQGQVRLQLRTTERVVMSRPRQPKPPAVPKTVGQLSLRELRQLSVMTAFPQAASDLYSWPPHKHRAIQPSTAPFSLTSNVRAACCCPDMNGGGRGKLHRWPCTHNSAASGTAVSYARSMAHDEAVSRHIRISTNTGKAWPPPAHTDAAL